MRKNNKALYEKIMCNVARVVKHALNENLVNTVELDPQAVEKTIIKLFYMSGITGSFIEPDEKEYYNDAVLDDFNGEIDSIHIDDNKLVIQCIDGSEINVNELSQHDLKTLYYIARDIVADNFNDLDKLDNKMEELYNQALDDSNYIGFRMNDEDKERLYKAFEECGYEECDFLKVDGEPIVLDSIYNDENVSIDVIGVNLACRLSNGEIVQLENIINDPDDIDTLENVITDYYEE